MEAASVPSEGGEQTQDQGQSQGVPAEVTEQLNALNDRFGQIEPVLAQFAQAQQQPEEQQQEPGFEDYYGEDGYMDPAQLQQAIQSEAQRIAQEQTGPLAQQLQQIQQTMQDEAIDGLMDEFPELQDQQKAQQFAGQVQQAASSYANQLAGGDPQLGQQIYGRLIGSPDFVAQTYLAGKAMEQAQQGVPAGDQGVHLEGGSAQPGEPQVDQTQERFRQWASQGAGGGVWGKSLDQL